MILAARLQATMMMIMMMAGAVAAKTESSSTTTTTTTATKMMKPTMDEAARRQQYLRRPTAKAGIATMTTATTNITSNISTGRNLQQRPEEQEELPLQLEEQVIRVQYGYFPEARPIHAACALGWFDLRINGIYYQVSCHPQTSGNFAASRLDNNQLQIANLGSTPLAQAIARNLNIQVVYISHYMGDSQGIYVRASSKDDDDNYIGITNPFELKGRTIGVPFGSTMHYQVLFLLDLFDLQGQVTVVNMSPTQIIDAWNSSQIDAAACWGVARDYVLKEQLGIGSPPFQPPANTLMSAGVLANWGRPTFVVVAANQQFALEHSDFIQHFVAILTRINDSFVDNLGQFDSSNIQRWQIDYDRSFVKSMADSLMNPNEPSKNPRQPFLNLQRRALNLFEHITSQEQLSCDYLGDGRRYDSCYQPGLQHIAIHQTALFLKNQKIISNLGIMDNFDLSSTCVDDEFCSSNLIDGSYLKEATHESRGYPVGPYMVGATSQTLISELERLDIESGRNIYAPIEIGRSNSNNPRYGNGHSTCSSTISRRVMLITDDAIEIGDGSNGDNGKTYSTDLYCKWIIQAKECLTEEGGITSGDCDYTLLKLRLDKIRIWSGDYLRVYTDNYYCNTEGMTLLGQFSGLYDDDEPNNINLIAKGCMYIEFVTDANQERSYGDIDNVGNGFKASISRINILEEGEEENYCTNGGYYLRNAITACQCDGFHYGGDCSVTDYCFGTNQLNFFDDPLNEPIQFGSSGSISKQVLTSIRNDNPCVVDPSIAYRNDMDCIFELKVQEGRVSPSSNSIVALTIYYDVEEGHDYIWLESGSDQYYVLTGKHENEISGDEYFIPIDSLTKSVSVRFTTDSRGRRGGFFAEARVVENFSIKKSCPTGYTGSNCEIPYCQPTNIPNNAVHIEGIDDSYLLGRVVSQASDRFVRPMPWSPVVGGCEWILGGAKNGNQLPTKDNLVAVRLMNRSKKNGFDLEPYPQSAVGDKLVLRTNTGTEFDPFFVEECDNDEVCSHPWQTGVCDLETGGCTLRESLEVPIDDTVDSISAFLMTDRNDGGRDYRGISLDAMMVQECPTELGREHCEAVDTSECVNGGCICEGGIPCGCPCDGESPRLIGELKTGLVVGVVVAIFIVLFCIFLYYRRRKIQKSRAQKEVIEAKEAELEAFRNSVVGMRTAIVEFLPTVGDERAIHPLSAKGGDDKIALGKPKIQWVWQETPHMMSRHKDEFIVGDSADCFIMYDGESNKKLEDAFQRQGGTGTFSPMAGYSVDFNTMIQTKLATGFQRTVQRLVQVANTESVAAKLEKLDLSKAKFGDPLPAELSGEPQMVLVKGDVIQISSQRQDGWAFGTKLHHSDEVVARELVRFASGGLNEDDANIFTDTGWFELDATEVPSGEDLATLQNNVGDTGALDQPSYWDPVVDPSIVQLHHLHKRDDEYQTLLDSFMSTLHSPNFPKKVKVSEIQRIQNLAMYQSYVVKRQTICYRETRLGAGHEKSAANQAIQQKALERFERRWLWHGANSEVMDKIMQQGFNRSFCGKNATMYGKGVYFARDASYSAHPAYSIPDANGFQYIMACRVVVGEYCPGTMDALTPDVRDANTQALYDSTVGLLRDDTMSNPSIYVTYHDAQAYPEYLIKFRLVRGGSNKIFTVFQYSHANNKGTAIP